MGERRARMIRVGVGILLLVLLAGLWAYLRVH
jgi:hypothetical protein